MGGQCALESAIALILPCEQRLGRVTEVIQVPENRYGTVRHARAHCNIGPKCGQD